MRAGVGMLIAALAFAWARLLQPAQPEPALPSLADVEHARRIARVSRRSSSALALLGDKELLFNDGRSAFIMYGIEHRSWIALGDPVGEPREMP